MKIVVRAPNWIGDSILAIPAAYSLSRNFPHAQIWVAAKHWVKELFVSHDFIKGIISLPDDDGFKSLKDSVRKIKSFHFDIGVLLTNSFSSALLFYLSKIPERWGYNTDGRRVLLTRGVALKKGEDSSHQLNYYLDLISGLGLKTSPPKISLPVTEEEKGKAKEMLLSLNVNLTKPLAILNPGASYGPSKRWHARNYAKLAILLQDRKKADILITGSKDEAELAESIASLMAKKPFNLTGKTNLRLLAGLISNADLFISNDSGPMHIANALKIPVIAIFGPTNPSYTGPFQQPAVVIKKDVPCWPCSYRECPFDHKCMISIDAEEVFETCQRFL
ncbi:MAG: lipopolysaccharide heptosyltransferase II [Candidatus Aminicenantes bacterium]|nr:lipopolysaccharide heptosyltransferase II [Candidatus Aminicenantes bacterium]